MGIEKNENLRIAKELVKVAKSILAKPTEHYRGKWKEYGGSDEIYAEVTIPCDGIGINTDISVQFNKMKDDIDNAATTFQNLSAKLDKLKSLVSSYDWMEINGGCRISEGVMTVWIGGNDKMFQTMCEEYDSLLTNMKDHEALEKATQNAMDLIKAEVAKIQGQL